MEYISHEDYKRMMESFSKGASKQSLNESLDPVGKEDDDVNNDGKTDKTDKYLLKRRAAIGKAMHKETPEDGSTEAQPEVLGHAGGSVYKIKSPSGKVVDVDFEGHKEDEIDPPYVWGGWIEGSDGEFDYGMDCEFINAGGGQFDWEPDYSSLTATPVKQGMEEYQFDQMYPDDPGPFEGKDVDSMIKEFLLKEDDVNWDRMDDEEAEENETDNGIEEGEDMEEGLNPAPFQATGPTIQTVEGKTSKLAHLTSEERDQLRQYVETIKTVQEQIKKMMGKTVEEGGDNTNLIMKSSTVSEKDGGDDDDIEDPEPKDLPDFIANQYESK